MSTPSFDANAFKDGVRREWRLSAPGWHRYSDIWDKGAEHISRRLVELAQIQPGHKVVDIASGLDDPALTAARQVGPMGQVIGTDLSPEMLAFARAKADTLGWGSCRI